MKESRELQRAEAFRKLSEATAFMYERAIKYDDRTEGGLIRCIQDYITIKGGFCERVHCMGIPKPTGTPGLYRLRPNTVMHKGTSDLHCIIEGMAVKIEIKIGSDRLSKEQMEYRDKVEAARGIYMIARTFDDFLVWFNAHLSS